MLPVSGPYAPHLLFGLASQFLLFFPFPQNWFTARVPAHVAHYARVGVFRLSPLRGVVPLGGPIGRVPNLKTARFLPGRPRETRFG